MAYVRSCSLDVAPRLPSLSPGPQGLLLLGNCGAWLKLLNSSIDPRDEMVSAVSLRSWSTLGTLSGMIESLVYIGFRFTKTGRCFLRPRIEAAQAPGHFPPRKAICFSTEMLSSTNLIIDQLSFRSMFSRHYQPLPIQSRQLTMCSSVNDDERALPCRPSERRAYQWCWQRFVCGHDWCGNFAEVLVQRSYNCPGGANAALECRITVNSFLLCA